MRLNPAYYAAKELQKKSKLFNKVEFLQNQSNDQYCLITLPKENTSLILAGKSYRTKQNPHLAIYEYYKQSETQGLSVTHYTWYGVDENDTNNHIVLHAYFDRAGKYLFPN